MIRGLRIYILIAALVMAVVPQLLADERDDADEHREREHHRHKVPLSPRLIDLPKLPPTQVQNLRVTPLLRRSAPGSASAATMTTPIPDAAAQLAPGPAAPTFAGLNFEGMGNGLAGFTFNGTPPDTDGAVGRTQYVQLVNTSVAVFDKATGNLLAGPTSTNGLWSTLPATNPCNSSNDGDGIVLYDQLADRWLITQFANAASASGPFYECVAVSESADATQRFFLYFFSYSSFPDYPKLAIWPDAYYAGYNGFSNALSPPPATNGVYQGDILCALDRASMINGATPRGVPGPPGMKLPAGDNQICFTTSTADFSLIPSNLDGTPPPAGSPNFFLEWFDTTDLGLYKFHVDFNTFANSTLNGVAWQSPNGPPSNTLSATLIPVTAFTPTCGGFGDGTCIPQKGTAQQLDSLSARLMHRLAYRNFGSHESLVMNHSVEVNGSATSSGVRWYEIQSPNATPTVVQTGTWAPDASYRWMGSLAMDKFGNLAVGYSVSSSAINPSIACAARLSSDPAGTLGNEVTLIAGTGSEVGSIGRTPVTRWGDYSSMSVDPVDDCTFWYTNEYFAADGLLWNTRIGNFKLAQCQSHPLNISVTPDTGSGLGPVTFTFLYSDTGGAAQITTTEGVFNTGPSTASACAFLYNNTANTIQLYQNDGVALSAALTPGSGGILSNSQCSLNVTGSSVARAGDSLVLNLPITFVAGPFSGVKFTFLNVTDSSGNSSGLQKFGGWTVP